MGDINDDDLTGDVSTMVDSRLAPSPFYSQPKLKTFAGEPKLANKLSLMSQGTISAKTN